MEFCKDNSLHDKYIEFNKAMAIEVKRMSRLYKTFIECSGDKSVDLKIVNEHYRAMNEQYDILEPILLHIIENAKNAATSIKNQKELYESINESCSE